MATPLPFSGKREETEMFINSCRLYMSARSSEFYNEQAKVYWILSFMQTGTAQNWRNFIASHIAQGRINYVTVEQFLAEIEKKFGDMDKRTTSSLKLRMMVQGDKHADEHVQEFEKAAMDADYDGYPLIVEFKHSLNPSLRKRLTELRPMPTTIMDWYKEAVIMDRQWRVAKAEDAFYNKVNTGTSARKFPQTNNNNRQQSTSGLTYS